MGISKITRNFQITIPKDVRELKGLEKGDSVIFTINGNKVNLIKAKKEIITATAGLWPSIKESSLDYERRIRKGWKKRVDN